MMKGKYGHDSTDLRKEEPNFRASDCFAGGMASAADRAAEEGEGAHAGPGPTKRGTPRAAFGTSGKELRLRRSRWKGIVDGPLRRTQPTGHLPQVRTGLGRGLPELFVPHGSCGWRGRASECPSCGSTEKPRRPRSFPPPSSRIQ